jgi:thiosulfate/3-mercaptopyruvate sulfurtransferase
MNKPLTSSQWLFENLTHPDIIILDASQKSITAKKVKPNENLRIKGARYFDLKNNFSDKSAALPNTFPNTTQFEDECQKLGINETNLIVVYDNLGIYSSPRVWWMLKIMGHKNVTVLNGGLPDWIKNKYPIEDVKRQQYKLGNFKAKLHSNAVKDFNFIKGNAQTQTSVIIDARSEGRFNGTAPEPREGLRSGSIPSSLNIPFGDVLENGKFKPEKELKAIFSKINPEEKELVYSCGSGLTACIILLAGELVLPNTTAVYDGSWTEWAQIEE